MMACVALEGYHSQVSYQWWRGDDKLPRETFPILYTSTPGTYRCTLSGSGIWDQHALLYNVSCVLQKRLSVSVIVYVLC